MSYPPPPPPPWCLITGLDYWTGLLDSHLTTKSHFPVQLCQPKSIVRLVKFFIGRHLSYHRLKIYDLTQFIVDTPWDQANWEVAWLCLCIGLGNGFWIWGGGGGGGGGAQTSAQLECVWARNVFGRQRKSVTLDQFLQLVLCYGVNFLWGVRNWLHNKAERGGLIVAAYI